MSHATDEDDMGRPFPQPKARDNRKAYRVVVKKTNLAGCTFKINGDKRFSKEEYFECDSSSLSGEGVVHVVCDDPRDIYNKFGDIVVSITCLGPGFALPEDIP